MMNFPIHSKRPVPKIKTTWPATLKTATTRTAREVTHKAFKKARKQSAGAQRRKALEASYKAACEEIHPEAVCAVCGVRSEIAGMERHHVAGRRKASMCFFVLLHTPCHHERVHANPKWAEANGLLWSGRNSKTLTLADANRLLALMPHPPSDCIPRWIKHTPQ
jgi:hypothetical protein